MLNLLLLGPWGGPGRETLGTVPVDVDGLRDPGESGPDPFSEAGLGSTSGDGVPNGCGDTLGTHPQSFTPSPVSVVTPVFVRQGGGYQFGRRREEDAPPGRSDSWTV